MGMTKIVYFSQSDFAGIQEEFLRDSNNIVYLWYSHYSTDDEDVTGLTYKYPDRLKIINGPVSDTADYIKMADFVYVEPFCDRNFAYQLRKRFEHLNPNFINAHGPDAYMLETDRFYGKYMAEMFLPSVDVNDIYICKTRTEMSGILDRLDKNYVVKRLYDRAPGTFIPNSKHDLESFARHDFLDMFKTGGVLIEPKQVGYEIGIGGWFDGHKFCNDTILLDQEYKGALSEMQGNVLTPQAGTCGICVHKDDIIDNKLFLIVEGMEKMLRNMGRSYVGFFNGNFIFKEDGEVSFLEFTTRPGIPTEVEASNYSYSFTNLMKALVTNQGNFTVDFDTTNYYIHGSLFNWGTDSINTVYLDTKFRPKVTGLENLSRPYNLMFGCYDRKLNVCNRFVSQIVHIHSRDKSLDQAIDKYREEANKISCFNGVIRQDIGNSYHPTKLLVK